MLQGAGRSGVLEILAFKSIRVVADAQALAGRQFPIRFAQVDVVVQGVAVGGQVLLQRVVSLNGQRIGRIRTYGQKDGIGGSVALAVVIEKEESFIPYNRPAQVAAELIEVVGALGSAAPVVFPRVRIESFIAEKFERRSVEVIRAGLGDHVDDAAAGAPDLGRIVIGIDLELLDGVFAEAVRIAAGAGASSGLSKEDVIGVGAIHQKAVGRAALAAEGEVAGARGIAHDARRQYREIKKVPPVDRQAGDLLGGDRGAGLRSRELDNRRFRGDAHSLLRSAHLEGDVDGCNGADVELEPVAPGGLESGGLDAEVVNAGRKFGKRI